MTRTAVIIASWNGKQYLKDCFDSLAAQSDQNFKIYFVDNGSTDGSVEFVEKNYSKNTFSGRLKTIRFEKNTGFARGYNAGIEKSLENEDTKFFLVLNNDTKLERNCLQKLLACAEKYPAVGAIQPKVLNFFEKDKIDCAGIVISRDGTAHNRGYGENEKKFERETEIFGANGTASLFRREALEETRVAPGQYFDNDFFAYYEDTDLAWRLRLAGFKAYYCPEAHLFHVHSATAGKFSLFKAYYLHRNYFFVVFKNYPAGIMIKTLFFRIFSYIRLILNIFGKEKKEAGFAEDYGKGNVALEILKAWGSVVANVFSIAKKRSFLQKKRKVSRGKIKSWLTKFSTD